MLLLVRIRLTYPFLGELKKDHRGVRRFKTDRGNIVVTVPAWQAQIAEAAKQLGFHIDPSTVIPKPTYPAASIHLFNRRHNRVKSEMFESFRKGTILTLEFVVRQDMPRAPTPYQLEEIFKFIGDYLGLSQWGNKFGYGRFELCSIEPKDTDEGLSAVFDRHAFEKFGPTYVVPSKSTSYKEATTPTDSPEEISGPTAPEIANPVITQ